MTARGLFVVGINATNLRAGGGITYLSGLLSHLAAIPAAIRPARVVVWGGGATLAELPDVPDVHKVEIPEIDGALFDIDWRALKRIRAQYVLNRRLVREHGCTVLFQPGGTLLSRLDVPVVTISRNMLPFLWRELLRYGASLQTLRLIALRYWQAWSFLRADGVIFLSTFARDSISRVLPGTIARTRVIPHGVASALAGVAGQRRRNPAGPFVWIYVSTVCVYKHQECVAHAAAILRERGMAVEVRFVGSSSAKYGLQLKNTIAALDREGTFLKWVGPVRHAELGHWYGDADGAVFASSCENMPHILLECMTAGLPLACSAAMPMPLFLRDAGVYFQPEEPHSIARAMAVLMENPSLRAELAEKARSYVRAYRWERCCEQTFEFLHEVAHRPAALASARDLVVV
jgi:glycosyltransferase involved in cell wall biosynthesis